MDFPFLSDRKVLQFSPVGAYFVVRLINAFPVVREKRSPRLPIRNMIQSHSLRLLFAASLTLAISATLITSGFAQDKKLNAVAMSVGDLGNPFFVQIAHGAENKAKEINPQVKFNALSSNYDVKLQSSQMDDFISTKPDLIMLGAADSKRIAPAVKRAKKAGITIVALDVGAEGGVDATLTSDNKQAGRLDGQYIADRLKGKGQIVILNGPPVTSIQDRVAGALQECFPSSQRDYGLGAFCRELMVALASHRPVRAFNERRVSQLLLQPYFEPIPLLWKWPGRVVLLRIWRID